MIRLLTALGLLSFILGAGLSASESAEPDISKCYNHDHDDCRWVKSPCCTICGDTNYIWTCTRSKYGTIGLLSKEHRHEAVDYATQTQPDGAGCAPCGTGTEAGGSVPAIGAWPHLSLKRYRRSHQYYGYGSFGRACFSEYDDRISVFYEDSHQGVGVGCIRVYLADDMGDTRYFYEKNTSYANDNAVDGIYRDEHGVFASLTLYDASNAVTTDQDLAVTAVLADRDGNTRTFEIFVDSTDAKRGRLIARADRNGITTTVAYVHTVGTLTGTDRSKYRQIATVTDPYGKQATFTYHPTPNWVNWRVASVSFPNGTSVTYGYDTANNLSTVTYPDGTASSFAYGHDATTQFDFVTFDDAGAEATHRRKTAYYTALTYQLPDTTIVDQAPGIARLVKNPLGETTFGFWESSLPNVLYFYGGGNELLRFESGSGQMIASVAFAANYVHDDQALVPDLSTVTWIQESDPTYAHYRTYLNAVTDPYGRSYSHVTDAIAGVVTTHTGEDGLTETMTYGPYRQVATSTDALGRVTTNTYDSAGNRLTQTRATGTAAQATWSWTYNGLGQPLTATDAEGNVTDYAYDSAGHLVTITEPADVPAGPRAVTTFTWDSVGRLATRSDPDGRTATFGYDTRNRLTSITYPDTSTQTYTYGTGTNANLLVATKDRNDNVTTFGYDGFGRKIQTVTAFGQPEAITELCTFLPGTTIEATCSRSGDLTTYGFDFRNRVISTSRQASTGTTLTSTIELDILGRTLSQTDPYGRRTFSLYDVNDRPTRTIRELIPHGLGSLPSAATPPSGGFAGTGSAGVTYLTSARDEALAALVRPTSANPAYVITEVVTDAEGQTIARIDGRGIRSTMTYDAQGRLTASVEAESVLSGGSFTFLVPPEAARTEYTYDDQGNVLTVSLPRTFTRDSGTGVWSTGTEGVFRTSMTYTGRNLKATETVADGLDAASQIRGERATTAWTYTKTQKVATITDPRLFVTEFRYGVCCDRLAEIEDPVGALTSFDYDAYGNRTLVLDPNGLTTVTAYDGLHRPIAVTNGAGETSTMVYDDNLTDGVGLDAPASPLLPFLSGLGIGSGSDFSAMASTNPEGETAYQIRDGLGRTVRSVDPLGHATTVAFDAVVTDLVETTITDALAHVTATRADGAGLVRESEDALGEVSTAAYDANGNRLQIRDPNGIGQDCVFDARNRDIQCTDTAGAVTSRQYDAHSNVVVSTDALSQDETCVFDARDRKITCTDRVNATTTFAYDLADNLIQIEDAEGGVTDYVYDGRNLLTQETFPNGQQGRTVRTYGYDLGRRLASRVVTTDPASAFTETTGYAYDGANRLTARTYPDGKNDGFTYDDASRLLTATSARYGTTVTRVYDDASRLTAESLQLANGTLSGTTVGTATYNVGYAYDDANRLTATTYPDTTVVERTWTDRNELDTVTHAGQLIIDRTYDDGMRLTSTTYGNALVESRTYVTGDNLVATIAIPSVTGFSYTYDANKRKTAETDGILAASSQTFGYDDQDRLTDWERPSAPGGDAQTWTLSPVGDWNQTVRNADTQTRTHTDVHELTGIATNGGASIPLTYDAKGNLTQDDRGVTLTWDPENRLISARVPSTASPSFVGLSATYQYDALGRRVAKTVNGRTTVYACGGAQVLNEFERAAIPSQAALDGAAADGEASALTVKPASGGILQAAGTIRINAQPATTVIPDGFWADKGSLFGMRTNGATYGWASAQPASRQVSRSGAAALVEFDTHSRMKPPSESAGSWSIALPNGSYPVIVVCGDPLSTQQTNDLTLNGISLTDPDPAAAPGYTMGDFDGYAVQATVTGGLLTLDVVGSSVDPKLCFVEIGPEGTTLAQADIDRLDALIAQMTDVTWEAATLVDTTKTFIYGSYVDELISYTVGSSRYFVHSNHLYSPSAVTTSTGQVAERYRYDAYGKRTVLNAAGTTELAKSAVGFDRGFTGYILDQETGLYYARARMYDGRLGRFIGRDGGDFAELASQQLTGEKMRNIEGKTLGYIDGFNLYRGYFAINSLDPFGNECLDCHLETVAFSVTEKTEIYHGFCSAIKTEKLTQDYFSSAGATGYTAAQVAFMLKAAVEAEAECNKGGCVREAEVPFLIKSISSETRTLGSGNKICLVTFSLEAAFFCVDPNPCTCVDKQGDV